FRRAKNEERRAESGPRDLRARSLTNVIQESNRRAGRLQGLRTKDFGSRGRDMSRGIEKTGIGSGPACSKLDDRALSGAGSNAPSLHEGWDHVGCRAWDRPAADRPAVRGGDAHGPGRCAALGTLPDPAG